MVGEILSMKTNCEIIINDLELIQFIDYYIYRQPIILFIRKNICLCDQYLYEVAMSYKLLNAYVECF